MIAKCKYVARRVGPAKVHRGRLKVKAPCIFDILTDVVENGVNRDHGDFPYQQINELHPHRTVHL